jgi:hypothetical protein
MKHYGSAKEAWEAGKVYRLNWPGGWWLVIVAVAIFIAWLIRAF